MDLMLAQAAIIGRQHRLMNHNCQDFALTRSPEPGCCYGLVLDGCGGKYRETADSPEGSSFQTYISQNEVGAKVTGQFMGQWLERHLCRQEYLDRLPEKLQLATERFLEGFVSSLGFTGAKKKERFVRTNLLATVLGFVMTPAEGCFFWMGDGYLAQNGEVTVLDWANQPPYLAYNLLSLPCQFSGKGGEMQSRRFSVDEELKWVAVATDGWQPNRLAELERPQSSLHLQRWVNVEARQRGSFEDDGAVAMWVKDDDCN
jgi:hypothetical protein